MCGIYGIILPEGHRHKSWFFKKAVTELANASERRGRDSAGLALSDVNNNTYHVLKGDVRVRDLLKDSRVDSALDAASSRTSAGKPGMGIGHARLVTNGSQLLPGNNQPVIKDDLLVIHNGIIANVDDVWEAHSELTRDNQIDTEVIPALLRNGLEKGMDPVTALSKALAPLIGTWSLAIGFSDRNLLLLTSNNGSLYRFLLPEGGILFGSERHILETVQKALNVSATIDWVGVDKVVALDTVSGRIGSVALNGEVTSLDWLSKSFSKPFDVDLEVIENTDSKHELILDPAAFQRTEETDLASMLVYDLDRIRSLKRCSRCILPETFPFIRFDDEGICNYCHSYELKNQVRPIEELKELVLPYRRKGKPDVIIPFSGGRDSTYTLHLVKEELGLNPIAFTYDWGMVTDLARRNIARVCGKLGVENIIVAADVRWKRNNIRKNLEAWLKRPHLGMIPLLMAGDKYFFYYCDQVKKQTGIDLNIWGINFLENTDFKTGFAGLPPDTDKDAPYALSLIHQLKLFGFVGGQLLSNPGYLNGSIWDSLGSFAVRYMAKKDHYYHLFDYVQWKEEEVNEVLKAYDWEIAVDTESTWRIGDGTASFYNYVYATVAGFTEFDTFRSNQIREGMMDRETALALIEKENSPRFETLRWYLQITGVDFKHAISTVNAIPRI